MIRFYGQSGSGGGGTVDIHGLTAIGAAPASNDEFIIYDTSASTNKKLLVSNLAIGNAFTMIQCDAGTDPTATSSSDTLIMTSSDGNIVITGNSGTNTVEMSLASTIDIGDPGSETSGIDINGTTYTTGLRINDFGGTKPAQLMLHRHSTTYESVLVGSRSNSDTSSHTSVTTSMNLLSFYGAGWTGTHYDLFAAISLQSDTSGTISGTSSPGRISFYTVADGSNALTSRMTINNAGVVEIATTGTFTCPGSGSNSEVYGASSSCTQNNSVVVGNSALNTKGPNSVVIGYNATYSIGSAAGYNVVIGANASCAFYTAVVIGADATVQNAVSVAIGDTARANLRGVSIGQSADSGNGGQNTIIIGASAGGNTNSDIVILGAYAQATASNQMVVGSATAPVNDYYFGEGVTSATPQDISFNATGGSGTDVAAADFYIAGGRGTGTGAGGSLIFQTAPAGTSGSSLNSLVDVFKVSVDGTIHLPVLTDSTRPAAGTAGRMFFNSDDGQLNIDDGTNWTLPDGTTT